MPLPPRSARLPLATICALLLLAQPAAATWVWPARGEVIAPYRNGPDPYAAGQHRGIDIAARPGAPVVAAVGGVVRFAGSVGSSGLTVGVRSADGRFDVSYLHLSAIAVREGQRLAAGQRLGAAGTTGLESGAPHLHLGVRDAGTRFGYRDPLGFLPPPSPARRAPRERPAPTPLVLPSRRAPAPEPARTPPARPTSWAPAPRAVPMPGSVAAGGGVDLGLALVFLGPALAAALAGLSRGGRRTTGSGRRATAGGPRLSSIGGRCPSTSRRPSTT
jgi:hypothetical protein